MAEAPVDTMTVTASPRTTPEKEPSPHVPGEIGTWIVILGEMAVFTVLFALYLFHRLDNPEVFRDGTRHLNPILGTVNTVVLLVSSLLVVAGVQAVRIRDTRKAQGLFIAAAACGVVFTAIKYLEYSHHIAEGHTFSASNFWSYYYVLTATHLVHVWMGLAVLWFVVVQARKPRLDREHLAYVEGGACFWHMVDLIWLILFSLVYLVF